MLRGERSQAVHAASNLVLLPVKDDDQFPVVDAFIRILRYICGGNVGQLEVGAAPGQGQPRQHASNATAVLCGGKSGGTQGAGDIVCGQIDNSLMISRAVGQNRLEGLVMIIPRLLDPGGHCGFFLVRNPRDHQVVPLQVVQLFQLRIQVLDRSSHLQHNGFGGGTLIDQLQVLVVASREVGRIHIQHALVDVQRLALLGVILQNNGYDASCAALDSGHALGLKFNDDFGQAHKITPFGWFGYWTPAPP